MLLHFNHGGFYPQNESKTLLKVPLRHGRFWPHVEGFWMLKTETDKLLIVAPESKLNLDRVITEPGWNISIISVSHGTLANQRTVINSQSEAEGVMT